MTTTTTTTNLPPALAAIAGATAPTAPTVEQAVERTSRDRLQEIRAAQDRAAALGFSQPQTLYALGHDLVASGEGRAKWHQDEVAKKPAAVPALTGLKDRVAAERRRDVLVTAESLLIDSKAGTLKRTGSNGKPGLLLTEVGLAQLLQLLPWSPKNAVSYLSTIDPEWRSKEFAKIVGNEANRGYPVRLRLRRPDPASEAVEWYATVTPKYTTVDADAQASAILAVVERNPKFKHLKAEIAYSGNRLRVNLIDHTDLAPKDTKVGDYIRATATVKGADDKSGGLDTLVSLLRVLCVNLSTGVARGMRMSLRHVGNRDELLRKLEANIEAALRAGSEVVHGAWTKAAHNKVSAEEWLAIARRMTAAEEGARKAAAVVQVPGTPSGALLNYILEAYAIEPDPSQIGMVNALSRTPQVGSWADPEDAMSILAAASGEVLKMSPERFKSYAN